MTRRLNQYFAASLFVLALLVAGCAARTGPIRGDASVQGDGDTSTEVPESVEKREGKNGASD